MVLNIVNRGFTKLDNWANKTPLSALNDMGRLSIGAPGLVLLVIALGLFGFISVPLVPRVM